MRVRGWTIERNANDVRIYTDSETDDYLILSAEEWFALVHEMNIAGAIGLETA